MGGAFPLCYFRLWGCRKPWEGASSGYIFRGTEWGLTGRFLCGSGWPEDSDPQFCWLNSDHQKEALGLGWVWVGGGGGLCDACMQGSTLRW